MQAPNHASLFLIFALQFPLISHARSAGAIGILSGLPPAGKLFGVEAPLTAEGTEIRAAEAGSLDHSGQLVESAPLLWWLGGGRHELTLLLPLAAPVVEGLARDPGGAGDLGHALPVGRAHALADLVAYSGVIGRLHGRRFGPLVDGSDRVDFFADSGGNTALANQRLGCGCLGWVGGFVFLFLFWPLGLALLLISFLFQIVGNQRSGSERAAMAVADAEALRLWEERKRLPPPAAPEDPLFRSAERIFSSLEEALAVGERLPQGPAKVRRAEEADQLLEELLVVCEEIAFLSPAEAEELELRVNQLREVGSASPEEEKGSAESEGGNN